MTYITKGEYQTTDDGYLIGYKLIRANCHSQYDPKFKYTQGKVAGHRPDEFCTWFCCKGPFKHTVKGKADQIHHCCTQKELERNWADHYMNAETGARIARLLIHPDDMIKRGVAYRAYVDMISPIMFQWGVFGPEGSIAPDLPPVTELAKKKLNAGLSVDEVISVVMTPAPELEKVAKPTIVPTVHYAFPANGPYYYTLDEK